eukprot:CAMPEP_0119117276 /NCGR_PEP_ID=MMETSP1180-20130426/52749_1 /TAXON_ID=3052 ORGANISM="Chlamydomonas cf sp, Strain CCMP681" /NCGR_SAMPLE_ID=MMETSP1180 /ASSEMBLY_ACC=CAM_ASM_000741 /LENGTH=55 /DNA_ID=CAMNT_0007106515 /DNA_START=818 /DNA_END=982 /DNA_ORIENTATION=+
MDKLGPPVMTWPSSKAMQTSCRGWHCRADGALTTADITTEVVHIPSRQHRDRMAP